MYRWVHWQRLRPLLYFMEQMQVITYHWNPFCSLGCFSMKKPFILLTCPILLLPILLVPYAAPSPIDNKELEIVLHAHESSRQMIGSFRCRVYWDSTITSLKDDTKITKLTCSGTYSYSPNATRGREIEIIKMPGNSKREEDVEYVWKDSIRYSLLRQKDKARIGAVKDSFPLRYHGRSDPCVRGLIVINRPGSNSYAIVEDVIRKAYKIDLDKRTIGGKDFSVVTMYFTESNQMPSECKYEIYFDHSVNFLISKTIRSFSHPEGTYAVLDEVIQFIQCSPGIYFPEKARQTTYIGKNEILTGVATLSEINIHPTFPEETFRMSFPNDITMNDAIRGVSYRIDSAGNQTGNSLSLSKLPPPKQSPLDESVSFGEETKVEPSGWSKSIIAFSIIILLLSGSVVLIRRRKGLS